MKFIDCFNSLLSPHLRSVVIHVSIWIALLTPMYYYSIMMDRGVSVIIIISHLTYVALFYLNYSVLVERLLFKGKIWGYVLTNVVVFTSVYFLRNEIGELASRYSSEIPRMDLPPHEREHSIPYIFGHILFSIFVIAPSLSIKMTAKWLKVQQKIRESESMRVEMELTTLKNQLNPHFLFNSLNNIYALISFNPSVAQSSLMNVCDLLRYQLYDSDHDKVELDKEIQFLENYCSLMRLRLSAGVSVTVDLPQNTHGIRVAPLLFISLVENAFKHGVDAEKESYIHIRMSIVGGVIHLVCRNSNHPKTTQHRSGSGIGLVNLQRRLDLIYPHTHTYQAEIIDQEYCVTLTLNTQQK